ncbi:hypothetical protein B9Z55_014644 [Caenorhabditis nigoni]|uniref:Uncharacterized protein n=1 Tax=Caenorhabditis nigoni TaxID=1611254 RepID=A0A2G5U6Q1_9PELO|nr:hypothetical protein B9Z55_014644 [Caenorhabditis nigoni]
MATQSRWSTWQHFGDVVGVFSFRFYQQFRLQILRKEYWLLTFLNFYILFSPFQKMTPVAFVIMCTYSGNLFVQLIYYILAEYVLEKFDRPSPEQELFLN